MGTNVPSAHHEGGVQCWRHCLLQDIAAPVRNAIVGGPFVSDLVSSDYCLKGIPVIRGENIASRRWVGGDFVFVSPEKAEKLSANTAGPFDIVFTQRGENHYKQVAIVPLNGIRRFVISQSQMKASIDPAVAHHLFIYYTFRTPELQDYLVQNAIQIGVSHTNLSILRKAPVRTPPLSVQQNICRILGALDDKIDLNRRMNETLEAMARAIFKDWFVDFGPVRAKAEGRPPYLVPELWSWFPDALDDEDKPVGWEAASLLDLCQLKRGYDLPTGQRIPGPHPIISSSGKSGHHSMAMADAPGVVTGRYGTVGEVFFINQPFWPLNTALYVNDFKGHPHRFVYYMLREVDFLRYSDKAAVPGVNRNHLHQASVILPTQEAQQAFARALEPMWARQESNDREIETLSQLRDLLLPKLMSGEIRLRDAEQAVEAAL
ncbi:type I restriction enzyme, S subunit [Azospirillaceae bacterium]